MRYGSMAEEAWGASPADVPLWFSLVAALLEAFGRCGFFWPGWPCSLSLVPEFLTTAAEGEDDGR